MALGTNHSCPTPNDSEEQPAPAAAIDDDAIAALDMAARAPRMDNNILSSAPARDIRSSANELIEMLEEIDLRKMLRKQGPIGRFTGAAVEARLEFELASHRVADLFRQLSRTAQAGGRLRGILDRTRLELIDEQARLARVISDAKLLVSQSSGSDLALVARFERRLSNIMAMEAANTLTIQQIELSGSVLASLLDRFTDIETLLLPLWQRNALAIIHGEAITPRSSVVTAFLDAHRNLIGFLKKVGQE
ncbi:hypothetical protein FHT72_001263 [Rhizobium sp. BK077]|uniref:Toxic anion resistance protein n=2 Tax=Rhizobium anhuiense TaxID=1184720 RepID=A0A3S0XNY7_9HYPH|nr:MULTISPECIES: hypothetical protein [Rhizobium]KZS49943.1 hypothetical protein AS890_12735 [Rhizobium anhuiense bv. trifolii]MBB3297808.1 hypothetical protein [Rhizobium sp. BK112]MBB3366796.1 hypothetical protein [Rhizobium sp. BK077]MBB4177698.1 hypothetical protein [Rhizobium sp. BK109]RUM02524.1 hypothetical protein EEQ99_12035 [Rhizobium anhuiense]